MDPQNARFVQSIFDLRQEVGVRSFRHARAAYRSLPENLRMILELPDVASGPWLSNERPVLEWLYGVPGQVVADFCRASGRGMQLLPTGTELLGHFVYAVLKPCDRIKLSATCYPKIDGGPQASVTRNISATALAELWVRGVGKSEEDFVNHLRDSLWRQAVRITQELSETLLQSDTV